MAISRRLGNLGDRIDSASSGNFLTTDDSGGEFRAIQYSEIAGKPTTLDSANVISFMDSSYVQARQVDVGLDSSQISSLVDSAYVQARQGVTGLDSAATINLIDSAYVALKGDAGLDSSGMTNLVDSSFIANLAGAKSGFEVFKYTATAGQTTFKDSDLNGSILAHPRDGLLVWLNGVLLDDTTDYTAPNGSSVVLTSGADSGSSVIIAKWGGGPAYSTTFFGSRGLVFGGYSFAWSHNDIQYIPVATSSNATDFGDLTSPKTGTASHSDGSRILNGGGYDGTTPHPATRLDVIEYVTASTTGNGTDFGDLTVGRLALTAGGDPTRTLFAGGRTLNADTELDTIEYVTTQTTGNSQDFGDLSYPRDYLRATSDATRTVFAGGDEDYSVDYNTKTNIMEYVTTQTPGNTTDFGDLTAARASCQQGVVANSTRGVFMGGASYPSTIHDEIDYITIATTGNASDFGDMTKETHSSAGMSDGTYGLHAGGAHPSSTTAQPGTEQIGYITIATTGNAQDFGDLLALGPATPPNSQTIYGDSDVFTSGLNIYQSGASGT
jgi:hypothetical protein|tara:strand:- start:5282 stop:6940 length:1659 start_codon:yes stop_codon:yes gene_type:complete